MDSTRIPYIDKPLPPISTRIEWQLFASRPVPSITARMSRHEILQIVGDESAPGDHVPTEPAVDGPRSGMDLEPDNRPQENQGASNRSPAKYRKPMGQPNRPGSGGYQLEAHLVDKCEWTKSQFKEVQVGSSVLWAPVYSNGSRPKYISWQRRNWSSGRATETKTRRRS
jgi:hypothetical protein